MSFCQTRKRSTQSSKVERRVAGMSEISFGQNAGHFIKHLTSLKLGLTLFHEGANAFEAIVRMETFELGLDFALERFHQSVFFACEDGLFHSANASCGPSAIFLAKAVTAASNLSAGKRWLMMPSRCAD